MHYRRQLCLMHSTRDAVPGRQPDGVCGAECRAFQALSTAATTSLWPSVLAGGWPRRGASTPSSPRMARSRSMVVGNWWWLWRQHCCICWSICWSFPVPLTLLCVLRMQLQLPVAVRRASGEGSASRKRPPRPSRKEAEENAVRRVSACRCTLLSRICGMDGCPLSLVMCDAAPSSSCRRFWTG